MKSQEIQTTKISLGIEAHSFARRFASEQATHKKSKQVYFNTLAVYAIHRYLNWLGVETDLSQSDCWNPVIRNRWNVADLLISNLGKLECRPVLPGETKVFLPSEVIEDRIGYLAVQFNDRLEQVKLLGFAQTARAEILEISRLRSLDELIDTISIQPVNLEDWSTGIFHQMWLPLEEIFILGKPIYARAKAIKKNQIQRAKKIDLGLLVNDRDLALVVSIWQEENQEKGVLIQIYPLKDQESLPPDLKLKVTLNSTNAQAEAVAREADNLIQLEFSDLPGNQFTVQVSLDNESITEKFIV